MPSRGELERLAADLPALWHAPATSHKDRKRLLRTVIADITLLPEPDQHKARIGIRWHTGATDEIAVARAAHSGTAKTQPVSPAVAMVIRLGAHHAYRGTGRPAQRCRAHHRHRRTVRRQSRPVDPPRLPRPGPEPLRRRRDQRRRGRRTARNRHRRRLRLDQDRQTRRSTRPRQPTLHRLERPGRDRMPRPHNRIRAPQPGSAANHTPQTRLTSTHLSVLSGTMVHQRRSQSTQLHNRPEHPNP